MSAYTLQQIAAAVHGELKNSASASICISQLATDSRSIQYAEQTLFFCLVGDKRDGHTFIKELLNKGVKNFVVSNANAIKDFSEGNCIVVKDTLKALQNLAAHHRSHFNMPVVGVTGSNGKTIVKEWLFSLLSPYKRVIRSPKSYNSQLGVPLSVWLLEDTYQMAIFEAGISKPSEMEHLEAIIKPTIGIITNIGDAHGEGFISKQQKVNEKLKLFTHADTVIYCSDYTNITEGLVKLKSVNKQLQIISWSKNTEATYKASVSSKDEITLTGNNEIIAFHLPFNDVASVENAIHCALLMRHLGHSTAEIQAGMAQLTPVAMRLELKTGINNCSIINDSYNSDPVSLSIALDFLNQQQQHKKKLVILSDILQSGKPNAQLYAEIAQLLQNKQVTSLIGIGSSISSEAKLFNIPNKQFFTNTDEFIKAFKPIDYNNTTILIKGARSFSFERISKLLEQKAHQTVMEVNLTAMVHNLNYYKSKLKPSCKTMAMVKAFSYGSGTFEVANLLQFHKIDYLAVAYADEGLELRTHGITLPIMVMSPQAQSYSMIIENRLEPELYSFATLNAFIEELNNNNLNISSYPVHIKLDTGMHRLGFSEEDLPKLFSALDKVKNRIHVVSVFSHLSASDNDKFLDFTTSQINLFEKMGAELIDKLGYPVLKHISNSSAITRFPEAQFDMVRLGIGLYGISPNVQEQQALQPVTKLKTTISQIKEIKAGESVGYNRAYVATEHKTIATVAIGYADGYHRTMGNGKNYMLVNKQQAPVIGNICMDMCMLDITGIEANEGDEVLVFGDNLPVYEIAKAMNTIPYEVLTGISPRVKRVYYHE